MILKSLSWKAVEHEIIDVLWKRPSFVGVSCLSLSATHIWYTCVRWIWLSAGWSGGAAPRSFSKFGLTARLSSARSLPWGKNSMNPLQTACVGSLSIRALICISAACILHGKKAPGGPISLRAEVGTDVIALFFCAQKEAAVWKKVATFLLNYAARHIVLLFSVRV